VREAAAAKGGQAREPALPTGDPAPDFGDQLRPGWIASRPHANPSGTGRASHRSAFDRALAAAGRFDSDTGDVAASHDEIAGDTSW
jgi:hypothetical protein